MRASPRRRGKSSRSGAAEGRVGRDGGPSVRGETSVPQGKFRWYRGFVIRPEPMAWGGFLFGGGMVFLVRETLTKEDETACRRAAERWCRTLHKPEEGWGSRIFVCLYVTALWCFGLKILLGMGISFWSPAGIFALICVLLTWAVIWPWNLRAPVFFKPIPAPEWQDIPLRIVFFGDGCFSIWAPAERIRLGYSSVTAVWEDEGRFYLFFEDRPPLLLPKRGFSGGTAEEFRDFLEQEFGWPVERIK